VLTALVSGFLGVPAAEWAFREFSRLFLPSSLLTILLVGLAASIVSCVVLGAIILGPLAALGTWPPPGSARFYGAGLIVGALIARLVFGWRRAGV